jgi:hypothetical protein
MALLTARHPNPESAALSVALNRASKIDLLKDDARAMASDSAVRAQYERMASNNADNLRRDIAGWFGTAAGKRASAGTIALLFKIGAQR